MDLVKVGTSADLELEYLEEYRQAMEIALVKQIQQFDDWANAQTIKLTEEQKEEFWLSYSDEHAKINYAYPSIMRSSLLVATYSLLERHLINYCIRLWRINSYPTEPNFRNAIIVRAVRYLKDFANISIPDNSQNWEFIITANKIRNAIVHTGRKLNVETQKDLKPFVDNHPSITFESNNLIVFHEDFCKEFIMVVRDFLFSEIFQRT